MSDATDSGSLLKDLAATDGPLGPGVIPELEVSDHAFDAAAGEDGAMPERLEDYSQVVTTSGVSWIPILKRLSINLFIPFINGIMLGFGEIMAHEVGLLFGWRTANVVDPSARPPATNPRYRRKWLFGIM